MAFDSMLNHKCDIYHIVKTDTSPGYGLPSSPAFSYSDLPDEAKVCCHFHVKSGTTVGLRVKQGEPYANLSGMTKLSLPLGTDVRINDKIVHIDTGIEYTAESPVPIRNHHVVVMLRRTDEQEKL